MWCCAVDRSHRSAQPLRQPYTHQGRPILRLFWYARWIICCLGRPTGTQFNFLLHSNLNQAIRACIHNCTCELYVHYVPRALIHWSTRAARSLQTKLIYPHNNEKKLEQRYEGQCKLKVFWTLSTLVTTSTCLYPHEATPANYR